MSDEPYQRTARIMFLIVWIILFAGLFLFFHYHEKSQTSVYHINRGELSLSANKNGHYQIKGKINNQDVEFFVDTGATLVGIPQKIADRLHIKGGYPVTMSTANGDVTGYLVRLEQLSFGEFVLDDVKAVIMPKGDDYIVLLGMNVLSQFNIVQQGKKLILKKN